MCSRTRSESDFSERRNYPAPPSRKLRAALVPAVAVTLAGVIGGLTYQFGPTDIARAEADLQKARTIVVAFDDESAAHRHAARQHYERAADEKKLLAKHEDTADAEWVEWHRALADGHSRLSRAKDARRDNLLHLAAEYLRLLAEAESEILRAKDARDRGTPYKVAPRVRELLAPILGG